LLRKLKMSRDTFSTLSFFGMFILSILLLF
jgi:hypothetical protein